MNKDSSFLSQNIRSNFFKKTENKTLSLISLCLCFALLLPGVAKAQLADDATVLYYLIEMERKTGQGCAGETLDLPSIRPDDSLENAARAALISGDALENILEQEGLRNAPSYKVFLTGNTPKEAVTRLRAGNCPAMMDSRFTRVGAVKDGQRWMLILAGEPVQTDPRPDLIINDQNADPSVPPHQAPLEGTDANTYKTPANLSPEEAAFMGLESSQGQGSPQQSGEKLSPEDKKLMENLSPTESKPAAPQVTGTFSQGEGMRSAQEPKASDEDAKALVSDELRPLDPTKQDPIIFESPTESLPAEPQVTGVYREGRGAEPVIIPTNPGQKNLEHKQGQQPLQQ